jgi:hypothetical protein
VDSPVIGTFYVMKRDDNTVAGYGVLFPTGEVCIRWMALANQHIVYKYKNIGQARNVLSDLSRDNKCTLDINWLTAFPPIQRIDSQR